MLPATSVRRQVSEPVGSGGPDHALIAESIRGSPGACSRCPPVPPLWLSTELVNGVPVVAWAAVLAGMDPAATLAAFTSHDPEALTQLEAATALLLAWLVDRPKPINDTYIYMYLYVYEAEDAHRRRPTVERATGALGPLLGRGGSEEMGPGAGGCLSSSRGCPTETPTRRKVKTAKHRRAAIDDHRTP
jgi:hypothetical protein